MAMMRGLLTLRVLTLAALGMSALAAFAQPAPNSPPKVIHATDFLKLTSLETTFSLRYGHVAPDSVIADLNGRRLRAGIDYWFDAKAGRMHLIRRADLGDSLVVSYQFDATQDQPKSSPSAGLGAEFALPHFDAGGAYGGNEPLRFDAAMPASLNGLNFGLSKQDGADDASLLSEAVPGQTNSAPGGPTSASGDSQSSSVLDTTGSADLPKPSEASSAAVAPAASVTAAEGDAASSASALEGEDLKFQPQSFGLSWSDSMVSTGTTHFEQLNDEMSRAVGLRKQRLQAAWQGDGESVDFQGMNLAQSNGAALRQFDLDMEGKYTLKYGQSSVDSQFNGFYDLSNDEQQQWADQTGLSKRWLNFSGPLGPLKLNADQQQWADPTGGAHYADYTLQAARASFMHAESSFSGGFDMFGALTDGDVDHFLEPLGKLYDPNYSPSDQDRFAFEGGLGITRSGDRLDLSQGALKLSALTVKLNGQTDGALYDTLQMADGPLSASYVRTEVGTNFSELGTTLNLEQSRLGQMQGLDHSDLNVNFASKGKALGLEVMQAATPTGNASRTAFVLRDPKMELDLSSRHVDAGFTDVASVPDPEQGLLAGLIGFDEQQGGLKWQPTSKLHIDALFANATGPDSTAQQERDADVTWNPDKNTHFAYRHTGHDESSPLGPIDVQLLDHMEVQHAFGKMGTIAYVSDRTTASGSQNTTVGADQTDLDYQVKVGPRTSLQTDQYGLVVDDGSSLSDFSETISQQLTSKTGVTYTVDSIHNEGTAGLPADETQSTFGGWYEFVKGVKLQYGGPKNVLQNDAMNSTSDVGVSQGAVGAVQMGADYNTSGVAGQPAQESGRFGLSTVKPLHLGKLTDFNFTVNSDTQRQTGQWSRNNQQISFSGKWGTSAFGADYRSVLDPTTLDLAIDRSVHFSTDPSQTSKLRANFSYKVRSLPGDQEAMVRNYSLTARPLPKLEVTNSVVTNPELNRPGALFGTVTQSTKVDEWKLAYKQTGDVTVSGTYDESVYLGTQLSRLAGLTLTLNQAKASPISVFCGAEAMDTAQGRRAYSRFMLRYDPKPGPNSQLSLFLGNVNYLHEIPGNAVISGFTGQIRFTWTF